MVGTPLRGPSRSPGPDGQSPLCTDSAYGAVARCTAVPTPSRGRDVLWSYPPLRGRAAFVATVVPTVPSHFASLAGHGGCCTQSCCTPALAILLCWARALMIRPLRVLPRPFGASGPAHQCHSTRSTQERCAALGVAPAFVSPLRVLLMLAGPAVSRSPTLRYVVSRLSSHCVHSLGPVALPRLKPRRCARAYLGAVSPLMPTSPMASREVPFGHVVWSCAPRAAHALTVSPAGLV